MISEFKGKYFFLSNFYAVPVDYDGITYQNNEAAFQAAKCFVSGDPDETVRLRKRFENLDPSSAKRLGRKVPLREDWEEVKDRVMYEVCCCKFDQNSDLLEKLLKTGDEELIEGNTWGDRIWGVCGGSGQNRLGKILMQIRKEHQETAENPQ